MPERVMEMGQDDKKRDEEMQLAQEDLRYIWHPCSQMKDYETYPPIVIDRGKGAYLYSVSGKEYIDIISSWWCNLLGHCNPQIMAAISKQLAELEHVIFADFSHRPAIELCARLSEVIPPRLKKFNFADNGSASVECALKMAFQYCYQTGRQKKQKFMCLTGSYHGETIGALSVGSMDIFAKIYQPMLMSAIHVEAPDCYRCPYQEDREHCQCQCFQKMEEAFSKYGAETAAIIVEPLLQGSAGMRIYPALYLKKLRDLCDAYDVLLIADEIATGFGRTGTMFACEQADISPDIMCVSKGLTGGYLPMSITITTEEIYQAFYAEYREKRAFLHSHTYSGNPLGCVAALAVQNIFRSEHILERAGQTAQYLHQALLDALGDYRYTGEIRHIGLINALELVEDKREKRPFAAQRRLGYAIYREALKNGLLLRPLGDVLYFNPPLNIDRRTLDKAIYIMKQSIRTVLG